MQNYTNENFNKKSEKNEKPVVTGFYVDGQKNNHRDNNGGGDDDITAFF